MNENVKDNDRHESEQEERGGRWDDKNSGDNGEHAFDERFDTRRYAILGGFDVLHESIDDAANRSGVEETQRAVQHRVQQLGVHDFRRLDEHGHETQVAQ